ncbi:uncharacterized protein LOC105199981 isoform X1 [Solenopsis invicta]|uniref:uncharacterized protein LOC105199981 isoform X1 n=1 Tax=Solenopsis invicta TaxID=13686 RepID=UPI00193CA22B|nr:uncharacterized protein LOC105199981 isoform X1 [Solenopsis invicta]
MKVIVAFMIVAIVVCAMIQESKQLFWGMGSPLQILEPQPHYPGMPSSLGRLDWPFRRGHGNRHGHRDRHGHGRPPCAQLPDDCIILCPGSSTTMTPGTSTETATPTYTSPIMTETSAMPTYTSPIMTETSAMPADTTQQAFQTTTVPAVAGK